ncbi:Peptidase M23 [Candidatus Methylobacter favarea]|uniref:Peptidase M23 n=1 Tax=Candidatus Methylobacter favarea TaxID=2707345 RepID=A0A8S0X6Z5_9GAMM|nr:M23 family metallopeptidase [Candidatus Methylobacter favarea]CAA9889635.1 Peptidase M23 [Candidatus Methylobacter favarea]
MKIPLFIFILLSLFSLNATGQKLYKFQDKQGIWHFTDKPPKTAQKVEVRQMKAANKQLVWLLQSGEERQPSFYIRNDYAGPVEVEVDFAEQENVRSTPELPKRFVIESGKSDTLFEIGGINQQASWRMALKYRYTIGSPLAQYYSKISYLPPLAPGATFQISQAFNGSFSHTDEQNKYAVDIAMPVGTPIHAARAGIVMEVDNDFYKGGVNKAYSAEANNIIILHDDGSMAIYAHLELEKAQVYPGLTVAAGQLIGYSGNTGFSSGPHLHFAVQVNKGMELVSVPFTFADREGQAQEPSYGAWLKGFIHPDG